MPINEKLKSFAMAKNPNLLVLEQFQELEAKAKEMIEAEIEKAVSKLEKILDDDSIFNGQLAPIKKIAEKTAQQEIKSFKEETDATVKMALTEFKEKKEEILAILKNSIEQIKTKFLEEKDVLSDSAKKELEQIENEFKGRIEQAIADIELIPGPKGEKGENGYSPVKGKDYFDGYSPQKNKDYFDGKDGINGSPDKPEQIAEKLNKTEQSVNLKVIKGLEVELKTLRQNMSNAKQSSKGGGIGNIVVETPSGTINGSNRTFTLTTIPKSNAIILTVNGQVQRLGSGLDYTLSDKTITMLWDIPTGSDIYAWFIRK